MSIPITSTHLGEEPELARIPVVSIQDVLVGRLLARQEAARLGFTPQALTQIATAISEITRNVVQHARAPGHMTLFEVKDGQRVGIKIIVDDSGIGIADLERVKSGVSAGAGIPGSQKLMDSFDIQSTVKEGTTVTMLKWVAG
jgi:serine/threonine-protein kinase RsbT